MFRLEFYDTEPNKFLVLLSDKIKKVGSVGWTYDELLTKPKYHNVKVSLMLTDSEVESIMNKINASQSKENVIMCYLYQYGVIVQG